MIRSLLLGLVGLLVISGYAAQPVGAQNVPRPNRGQQAPREQVRAAGTIKEVGAGLMHVVGAGGDQWLVKVEANPKNISYVGSADESWLHTGALIRFSGRMDRRGRMADPIASLSVIALREGYQFGVTPEGGGAREGAGLFEDSKPEKSPVKKPAGPPEPTAVLVIGRLTAIKNGKLTIDAGMGKQIKAELADDARISLDLADLSWVRPGDKVELQGWAYPQQKSNVFAREITVRATQPLTGEKKRAPAKDADKEGGKAP